jgi:ROK family protein
MNVLAIDIGGTHVKILATGQKERREFESGSTLTPAMMVAGVQKLAEDWRYDAVSIGYPGPVLRNRPVAEPHNLAKGWVGFDFDAAFKTPVKVVNDAAMQALGSYKGGKMLFLGLGTGLGSTLIADGNVEPMELGHLRGLRGPARTGEAWPEEMAEARHRRGGTPRRRARTRRCSAGRRQRQAAQKPSQGLPRRRQRQRVPRRLSIVGEGKRASVRKPCSGGGRDEERNADHLLLPFWSASEAG